MKRFICIVHLLLAGLLGGISLRAQEQLPAWEKGYLDVHFISTGVGNCALMVMPDGTTLLIDPGELDPTSARTQSPRNTPRYPNYSKHGYEWQAAYIQRILRQKEDPNRLDYAFITHYHDDHYGYNYPGAPLSETGRFYLSGITGIADLISIAKLVDRGWDYPMDMRAWSLREKNDSTLLNYFRFVDYARERQGLTYEPFELGSTSQFRMLRDACAYPAFSIQNISGNGAVWKEGRAYTRMPSREELVGAKMIPDENQLSCGILIRYGDFKMYMGADIPGEAPAYMGRPEWADMETIVADVVGEVDVTTANHHANRDAMTAYYLSRLRPRVIIQEVWSSDHPGHEALLRMTSRTIWPEDRDLFATNMLESNRLVIGELIDQSYRSQEGHIVLRVSPGGGRYRVYVLNHETEEPYVKACFDGYQAKSHIPSKP